MKVAFYTLGCKVNQYESRQMGETLKKHGYTIVNADEKADIFIVNSCTVTSQADAKTKQHVRKFKRENPNSIVVLTGCMPQAYPKQSAELFEADIVTGNKSNSALLSLLDEYCKFGKRIVNISEHKKGESFSSGAISSFGERTRAYVKIQDGCNRFCSYCIIPFARGVVRSKPMQEIRQEVQQLAQNGFKEIVLVGINLSSYGQDIGSNFADGVKAADVDGIERIRLGSMEPDHLTEEVIQNLKSIKKLCPQFHISLQSGCDKTLARMKRKYDTAEYLQTVNALRNIFPNCSITTDFMVGFPGETDEEFEESLNFIKTVGFQKVHVFPYSPRKGTKAAEYPEQIPKAIKQQRCKKAIELAEKIRHEYFLTLIGRTLEVLFESKAENGMHFGYSENYTPVWAKSSCNISGRICKVKISEAGGDGVISEIVE